MVPEPYFGTSLKELDTFETSWNGIFDYDPLGYQTHQEKIVVAALLLRDDPQKHWKRCKEKHLDTDMTWPGFIEFLKNLQLDPANRRRSISLKHSEARQREKQPIRQFVDYLESLEDELEPFTEIQKADFILNKCLPEVRQKIINTGRVTQEWTREELVTTIAMMEEGTRLRKPRSTSENRRPKEQEEKSSQGQRASSNRGRGGGRGRSQNRQRDANSSREGTSQKSQDKDSKDSKDLSTVVCYNCQKTGHYANKCEEPKKEKRPRVARAVPAYPIGTDRKKPRIEITIQVKTAKGWRPAKALIDSGSDDNFISQMKVKEWGLETDSKPLSAEMLSGHIDTVYGTASIMAELTDSLKCKKQEKLQLYAIDMPDLDIVLGWPWLWENNPPIDWRTKAWRYQYDLSKVTVISKGSFVAQAKKNPAYALLPRIAAAGGVVAVPLQYSEYADVFSEQKADTLPGEGSREHPIELIEGATPPYGPIYNLSERELEVLREYLKSSEAKGWIRRSMSPAGAPILFVPKPDGTLRLCVDYRALNKMTVKNRHPLPLIGETLDRLRSAKTFTKLDLRNAYHRIRIRKGDEWKTAFRTRYGHYEYQVMPFGLANAPATFQAYINEALEGLMDFTCVVYLDDILIYSSDPAEHEEHVKQVLERLRAYGLYVKLSKCAFGVEQVEFLGYVISANGVAMELSRVETIKDWPIPRSYYEVQVFLGFANFYRRFIERYSAIARPLTSLMKGSQNGRKQGPFQWGKEQQQAFDKLRDAFVNAPVLIHFDPTKPIRLETDASGFAIAAILSQPGEWPVKPGERPNWHPVAFFSRKLDAAEMNYGTPDQELLAIVKSFVHWRHYLEGSAYPIQVLSDHNNLRHFMTTSAISRRQARWAQELSAYDFEIAYRPGKTNPADGPSRRPDYMPAGDSSNIMLPTLQNKLRVAMERGLRHQLGNADDTLEAPQIRVAAMQVFEDTGRFREASKAASTEGSQILLGKQTLHHANRPTGGDNNPATEAHLLAVRLDQPTGQMELNSGSLSGSSKDSSPANSLRDAGEAAPDADKGSHEYFLSRIAVAAAMESETAYTSPSNSLLPLLLELQRGDALANSKRTASDKDAGDASWTTDSSGLVRYRGKAYVPPDGAVRGEINKICHDDPVAGHFGPKKTLALAKRKYYWPNMDREIKKYAAGCDICQRVKARRHRKYGELQALPLPQGPFDQISMDFITDLPPSIDSDTELAHNALLVVVDRYTKIAKYIATRKTIDAPGLARQFIKYWFKDQGIPSHIVTDRGSLFTSKFWTAFCEYLQMTRGLSTAFHPQTDGQTERQNQTIETWLRCYVCFEQDDWVDLLPQAEFAYNNAFHESIGMSPNEARYGQSLATRQGIEDDPLKGEIPTAKERAEALIKTRKSLEESWRKAKEQYTKWYNSNHMPKAYDEGDSVLLSSKNIKTERTSKKLDHRFLGPFVITKRVGKQAYRLKLPAKYSRLHNVFHVSLLEPYNEDAEKPPRALVPDLVKKEEDYAVEKIVDHRTYRGKKEWRVRWVGWDPEEDQWLTRNKLSGCKELLDEYNRSLAGEIPARSKRRRVK
jgi:hypothetical protein